MIARASLINAIALTVFTCIGLAPGCALPEGPSDAPPVPDSASYPLVSDALERRCATLDCHGAPGRNLRLYTGTGLRLDPAHVPGSGSTTDAEYLASYRALIALEPDVLATVVTEGGDRPERLTLVRKGRGTEHHRAGAVLREGDDADRCLTSWLASLIDEDACELAADYAPPLGWHDEEPR